MTSWLLWPISPGRSENGRTEREALVTTESRRSWWGNDATPGSSVAPVHLRFQDDIELDSPDKYIIQRSAISPYARGY